MDRLKTIINRHEMFTLVGKNNERLISSNKTSDDRIRYSFEDFDVIGFTRADNNANMNSQDSFIFADGVRVFSKDQLERRRPPVRKPFLNTNKYYTRTFNPHAYSNDVDLPNELYIHTGNIIFGRLDTKFIKIYNDVNPSICKLVSIDGKPTTNKTKDETYDFSIKMMIKRNIQPLKFVSSTTPSSSSSSGFENIENEVARRKLENGTFNVPTLMIEFKFIISVSPNLVFTVKPFVGVIFNKYDDKLIVNALRDATKKESRLSEMRIYLNFTSFEDNSAYMMPWPFGNVSVNYTPCMNGNALNAASISGTLISEDPNTKELSLSLNKLYNLFSLDFFESYFNGDMLKIHPIWMATSMVDENQTDEDLISIRNKYLSNPYNIQVPKLKNFRFFDLSE